MCSKRIVLAFGVLACLLNCINAECNVVTKKEWDGLDAVRVNYLARPVDLVVIQHTVTQTCATDARCAQIVRNIQTYHMDQLNLWDIGSNFYVGGNGKIYEGVGWINIGAHTLGFNSRSIGISFIGNYNNDTPTNEMLEAVKSLLKCGVDNGHLTADYHVVGHKQLIATESPGRKLYSKIRSWPQWLEDASSLKH